LYVAQNTVAPHEFTEEDGATITQRWHEAAELVPCVGHCDAVGILGKMIARKHDGRLALDDARLQAYFFGQASVENNELRLRDGYRSDLPVEAAGQRGISVLEP